MAAGKAAAETETTSMAEAAAVGRRRHQHGKTMTGWQRPATKTRCRPKIALDNGDWYDNNNHNNNNGS